VASDPVERRLTAILSADAVGYSRLMSRDDEATVRTLEAHRRRIERLVDTFRGRVVDAPGDNLLAEFPSAAGSVRCAVEMQRALASANEELDADQRMEFRIGVHLGDVIDEGERIYGDGVNIAARLESLAEPGAICVSDFVYQQVRGKLDLPATDLGERELKNIDEPVRVHQIQLDAAPVTSIARAAAPIALEPPAQPSLGILPFVNMSGDRSQEYFGDGIFTDLMTELSRIPDLFLIGHAAMSTYKGTGAAPRDVAREVGVRHVLEGAVRKEAQRIRISARLSEGESGRVVWAERYDRDLEDVFAVQDEIVQEVVTALDVMLVGGEGAIVMRQHLRNPAALGLLYKGTDLMNRFNRRDMQEARHLFNEVIALEPECPLGYIDAAWTHYFDVERGWSASPEASLQEMSHLAHRGLELGDVSGYASLMLGHMHLMKREHDEALDVSARALIERPSCQGAYGLRANILNYCGSPVEALPLAQQAIRLSPVAQTFYPEVLANSHYLSGQLEEAIGACHQTLAMAPDSVNVRVILAAALEETGRHHAAEQTVREILSLEPDFSAERFAASQPYRDSAALERILASLASVGLGGNGDPSGAMVVPLAAPHTASRRRVAPRPRR
jgi:adenylate cyclase